MWYLPSVRIDRVLGALFLRERNWKMERHKREALMTSPLGVCLLASACCALWGSAFPCIKIGYQLFEIPAEAVNTQILFAVLRFTLAGLLVVAFVSAGNRRLLAPKKGSWGMIVKLSMCQTVLQYLFFYIGLANASGVKSSIIEGANVFISILVASLVFRQEKFTGQKIVGCLVGFGGVVLVNWTKNGLDMNMKWNGEGFVLLSTVAYAFSAALIKEYAKRENPVVLSGYQFAVGGLVMAAWGLLGGGRLGAVSVPGLLMLLYLAFVSAAAYTVWSLLLKHNPVSRVAVYGFMNPVFGVILSAWLLAEHDQAFGAKTAVALLLVCVGIYAVNRPERLKTAEI